MTARYFGRLYRDEPRQIRAIDSLFDDAPIVEDPNALLMEILAKGAYAPIRPEEEDDAAASLPQEFPDAYKREPGQEMDEDEDDDAPIEFQLPGTPPLVLNGLSTVVCFDGGDDEDAQMKKETPLKRALFHKEEDDDDEDDYGLPALEKKIKL